MASFVAVSTYRKRGRAGDRGQSAPWQIGGDKAEIDAIDDIVFEVRRFNFRMWQNAHGERARDNASGGPQPRRIANHQRPAARMDAGMTKTFHNVLGTDAGGIAHRDSDQRAVSHIGTLG
jgi:hypothetical protein